MILNKRFKIGNIRIEPKELLLLQKFLLITVEN